MNLGQQLLFFFSALGVFNGFLLAFYFLFIPKPKRIQNLLLGLLLLMLSLRIGKSVLYYFDWELPKSILQLGLTACLFIGPSLYFYINSILKKQEKLHRSAKVQLLCWLLIALMLAVFFPYQNRPELWNPEIVQGIYAVWVAYLLASIYLVIPVLKRWKSKSRIENWLLLLLGANLAIGLLFNSILYFGVPSYIYGPIAFSFLFYFLMAYVIFHPTAKEIIKGSKGKYTRKKIQQDQVQALKDKLEHLMAQKQLYKNTQFKLDHLATAMELKPHYLSQFLNDNMGKSFSDFVNEYRVEAACHYLQEEHHLTIEGIGQEVGFRSKTSFYNAFKKCKGLTPAQFARQQKLTAN